MYVALGGVPLGRVKGFFLQVYFTQWAALAAIRVLEGVV
jgi:hypothetical protein